MVVHDLGGIRWYRRLVGTVVDSITSLVQLAILQKSRISTLFFELHDQFVAVKIH
jgi:hypothetical protein